MGGDGLRQAEFSNSAVPRLPVSQLAAADMPDFANVGGRSGHHPLQNLPEDYGPRLVVLHVDHGISLDEDQGQAGVVRATILSAALVAKPHLPVGLVELMDALSVATDSRDAAHRHPLAGLVVVVRAADMGVHPQLFQLVRISIGNEPEVGVVDALLGGHRPGDEVAVVPPRSEHRGLDSLDELVQLFEFFL